MEILSREEFEMKLNIKGLESIDGMWLFNQFKNVFNSGYSIENMTLNEILDILRKFISQENIENIILFPNSIEWTTEKYSNNPLKFSDCNEILDFINKEIIYGIEDYYITTNDLDWFLVISHNEDFRIVGDRYFVKKFKDKYIYD